MTKPFSSLIACQLFSISLHLALAARIERIDALSSVSVFDDLQCSQMPTYA